MNKYKVLVSWRNYAGTIHSPDCRLVKLKAARDGVHDVEGASAEAVMLAWDEQNDTAARVLPKTKICKCAADRDAP